MWTIHLPPPIFQGEPMQQNVVPEAGAATEPETHQVAHKMAIKACLGSGKDKEKGERSGAEAGWAPLHQWPELRLAN